MKKIIAALMFILLLPISSTANAVEIKDKGSEQQLILTTEEYNSINDDNVYGLLSGVFGFEIGKKIKYSNLKFKETRNRIPIDLVNSDPKIKKKMSMFLSANSTQNEPYVATKESYLRVVVDGIGNSFLHIYAIGKDNICFGYRLKQYRGLNSDEVILVHRKDIKRLIHSGNPVTKDIELPSGEVLKSGEVDNYVHGFYIGRFDEVFRNIYEEIENDYKIALASKPALIDRFKNVGGYGEFKFGMSPKDIFIITDGDVIIKETSRFYVYTTKSCVAFNNLPYADSGNGKDSKRLYFYNNKLVAIKKELIPEEIEPTIIAIKDKYNGRLIGYSTAKFESYQEVTFGRDADKVIYALGNTGRKVDLAALDPQMYTEAVQVLERQQQETDAKKKSAIP